MTHPARGRPICFWFEGLTRARKPCLGSSAGTDVGGAPFWTLSINTLRCRPSSRGTSTSSPSSAPVIALPSGEVADRRPFSRSLPPSDKRTETRLWSSAKTRTTLSPTPIPSAVQADSRGSSMPAPLKSIPVTFPRSICNRLVDGKRQVRLVPAGQHRQAGSQWSWIGSAEVNS
jgi:hypothetical protein